MFYRLSAFEEVLERLVAGLDSQPCYATYHVKTERERAAPTMHEDDENAAIDWSALPASSYPGDTSTQLPVDR